MLQVVLLTAPEIGVLPFSKQFYKYGLEKVADPKAKPNALLLRLLRGRLPDADKFLDDKGLAMLLEGMNIPPDDGL